ncbi:MAG: helicase-related protein, partial [Bacteroidota bacterium]
HVINFELPNVPETYVHRIGRTGRAGASGVAISFCDQEEKEFLRDIQKLTGIQIPVVSEHPFPPQAFSGTPRPSGNRENEQRNRGYHHQRTFRPAGMRSMEKR